MLDLDGDGLELCRASGTILFDHNADGIKTGTGWIGSDDGILVRDLNGDGAITFGRELFGQDTVKLNGEKAANGFDALADLDSNHDGNFTSADLAWNQVKVWRDLDQDGVADAGELFTFDQLGISHIGVLGSTTNATGGTQAGTTVNGNVVAQSASFTQTINAVTTDRTVGAIDLVELNRYSQSTSQAVGFDGLGTLRSACMRREAWVPRHPLNGCRIDEATVMVAVMLESKTSACFGSSAQPKSS
jgi:hypothetical protein